MAIASLYLDENIGSQSLVGGLVGAGYAVTDSRRDLGYDRTPDDLHLYAAARRGEVLVTFDFDFIEIHGALLRWSQDHGIADIHAGILVLRQESTPSVDVVRLVDAFFAAQLPIVNTLYEYKSVGGWTRYRIAHTYP